MKNEYLLMESGQCSLFCLSEDISHLSTSIHSMFMGSYIIIIDYRLWFNDRGSTSISRDSVFEKHLYTWYYSIRISYIVHAHNSHHSKTVSFGENINGSIIKETCNFTWKCGTYRFDFTSFDTLNTWENSRLIHKKYFSWNNDIIVHFKIYHSLAIYL